METVSIESELPAFLWISDVLDGSPAQEAGLQLGDAIIQFG